jgi:DNA-binding transcriptional LysR family regulator
MLDIDPVNADRGGRRVDDGYLAAEHNPLRSQDLVSLPVLRALLRERSVTRAGESIGLSQPATSNALGRLRRRFGDDLLVRVGKEYQLTPFAQSLLERADSAFDAMERLFEGKFDPSNSTREFTLVLSDYSVLLLGAPLVSMLRAEAPGVRLHLNTLSTVSPEFDELLRQSDGVVLPPDFIRGHPSLRLLRDRWVCLVGSEAPVGDAVTTDDLGRVPWVASYSSTLFSSTSSVRQLRALGVEPRVEVTVEGFQAVPHLVAGSHRVGLVPEGLLDRTPPLPGLRVLPSPLPRNEHLLALYWDVTETNDPGHRWFRELLQRAGEVAMSRASAG